MGYFRVRISHITGDDGLFGAYNHTGRFQADLRPVRAVMTFSGRVRLRVDVDGVIRAGLHASFAADTDRGVKIDDAIFALVHGRDRANACTGWIGTMITAGDLKMAAAVGVNACLYIFDPGAINT